MYNVFFFIFISTADTSFGSVALTPGTKNIGFLLNFFFTFLYLSTLISFLQISDTLSLSATGSFINSNISFVSDTSNLIFLFFCFTTLFVEL